MQKIVINDNVYDITLTEQPKLTDDITKYDWLPLNYKWIDFIESDNGKVCHIVDNEYFYTLFDFQIKENVIDFKNCIFHRKREWVSNDKLDEEQLDFIKKQQELLNKE